MAAIFPDEGRCRLTLELAFWKLIKPAVEYVKTNPMAVKTIIDTAEIFLNDIFVTLASVLFPYRKS